MSTGRLPKQMRAYNDFAVNVRERYEYSTIYLHLKGVGIG